MRIDKPINTCNDGDSENIGWGNLYWLLKNSSIFMKQTAYPTLPEMAQIFKALGDEIRLKILALLSTGELCVCDIMEVLNVPQSTISRHLAYLKNSRWVVGRRSGKWMYYRLHPDLPDHPGLNSIQKFISVIPDLQVEHERLEQYLKAKVNNRHCS